MRAGKRDAARVTLGEHAKSLKETVGMSLHTSWMTVEQAAAFLSLPTVTLRRSFERNARSTPDGGTVAHVNGITARKIGRLWRVWLDAGWRTPAAAEK
jgi:hypothetical protein